MTETVEILAVWNKQTEEWEAGRSASPSTTDRAEVVEAILGHGLSDADLEVLTEWLFDAECWGTEPATLAAQAVQVYTHLVNQ